MYKNTVEKKLKYLVKWTEIFGPVNFKINHKSNKIQILYFRSTLMLIILLISLISYYHLLLKKILKFENLYVQILYCIRVIYIILRYSVTIFNCIFNKKMIINIWNNVLKLNKTCRALNLQCAPNSKIVLIAVFLPAAISISIDITLEFKNHRFATIRKWFSIWGILLTKILIATIYLQFLTLLIMYKNYFKQLNFRLKFVLQNNADNSYFVMKHIARNHQQFCDHINIIMPMFTLHILLTMTEAVMNLTNNVYQIFLVCSNYDEEKIYTLLISIIFVFEYTVYLLIVIIPCHKCMEEVIIAYFFKIILQI